jgi:hypothetical protein
MMAICGGHVRGGGLWKKGGGGLASERDGERLPPLRTLQTANRHCKMADLQRWRQQLAEDLDSDDDDGNGRDAMMIHQPMDDDLGLGLEEMPLPKRVPNEASFARAAAAPPPRVDRAPPPAAMRSLGAGIGAASESAEVLMHRLQVVQLKLEEREIELEQARQQVNGAPTELNDAREAKMKDLAKRAKAATMALGRERAKSAQLTSELATLKREGGGGAAGASGGGGSSAAARLEAASAAVRDGREGGDPAARERELKESRDRLAAANARLHEAKVSAQSSKAELERYKRALAKEVGEDVPLAKLLEESSGAKGRAQQITLLREQVKSLGKRLTAATNGAEGGDEVPPTPDGADDRQRNALNAIEADRRREHERALLREQELGLDLLESRRKVDALTARIRTLESDAKGKKDKLRLLIEKSDSDDRLVQALRAELDKHRKSDRGGGSVTARAGGAGGNDAERRAGEVASRMAQQQTQIDRQEQIIHALREQLQTQSAAARPPSSGRAPPQDLIVLQTENGKLRELVALLQEKLAEASEDTY